MKKQNRSEIIRQQRAIYRRNNPSDKRQTMSRLAYHYLKIAGIVLEPGEKYDANKIARGLSAIYQQAGKDEEKAKAMITEAGEYFNSKNLSWTPIAVWRDWELIRAWKQKDNPQLADVSQRRKL